MTVSLIVFISIKLKNNDIYMYIYKQRVIVSVVKDDDIIYKVKYMLGELHREVCRRDADVQW